MPDGAAAAHVAANAGVAVTVTPAAVLTTSNPVAHVADSRSLQVQREESHFW